MVLGSRLSGLEKSYRSISRRGEGNFPSLVVARGVDAEAGVVDGDFELIAANRADEGITFMFPCGGFRTGLNREKGEETTVVVFGEGFVIGAVALGKIAVELILIPRGVIGVFAESSRGDLFVEIHDARGEADVLTLNGEPAFADKLGFKRGVPAQGNRFAFFELDLVEHDHETGMHVEDGAEVLFYPGPGGCGVDAPKPAPRIVELGRDDFALGMECAFPVEG